LIALDLGSLPLLLWAPGWAVLLPPGAGPPFRPEQKVKLDKSEATGGGSFLRDGFLALTLELPPLKQKKLEPPFRGRPCGVPRLEKRETWGTPGILFCQP